MRRALCACVWVEQGRSSPLCKIVSFLPTGIGVKKSRCVPVTEEFRSSNSTKWYREIFQVKCHTNQILDIRLALAAHLPCWIFGDGMELGGGRRRRRRRRGGIGAAVLAGVGGCAVPRGAAVPRAGRALSGGGERRVLAREKTET
jgi:hypothetical protein